MAQILRGMGNILRDDGGGSGGGSGLADVTPVPDTILPDFISTTWQVVDATHAINLTIRGKARTNATGDPARVQLLISNDNGTTATILSVSPITRTVDTSFSVTGIVPPAWKVLMSVTQDAAGQGPTYSINGTDLGITKQVLSG